MEPTTAQMEKALGVHPKNMDRLQKIGKFEFGFFPTDESAKKHCFEPCGDKGFQVLAWNPAKPRGCKCRRTLQEAGPTYTSMVGCPLHTFTREAK